MDTTDFYAHYAQVLGACHSNRDELQTLLDPKAGFAPQLSKLCRKRLQELSESGSGVNVDLDDLDLLRLESDTWDLLQQLTSLRKTESHLPPTPKELLRENPYTPTAMIAQSIMRHSPLLNELVIVREWLHDTAPNPRPPEAATGYWKFTHLRLQQAQRIGDRRDVQKLVQELDPDAVNRPNGGKVLSADDANYEKALSQALYAYVRAGRLDDAVELCRKTRRPWRAASIRGSLLFEWRLLSSSPSDEEPTPIEDGWSGNKRRRLWKQTCTKAALNSSLSEPDRALHAALAPSPATSVVLKAACRTWLDHLWAQVSISCEGKQVDALGRAGGGGGYWEGGLDAVERIAAESKAASSAGAQKREKEEEEKADAEWEREVVSSLESLANVGVSEGPPSTDPFHISQLHIILNRSDKLLAEFATGLQIGEFNSQQPNFNNLIRFFAHLCLFLQMIDMPVPADATQTILEVYLQVLEEAGQREHIALYASALGENAVERYALFLTSLDLNTDTEERRAALLRAEKHELDMVRVAQVTAEKSLDKAFEALPRMRVALPPVVAHEIPLSDMELFLIRSIEWTTFAEATYRDALEQANAIFRYFLGSGKIAAAKTLLGLLPSQLRSLPLDDGPNQAQARAQRVEFAHYLQFFGIWDMFGALADMLMREGEATTKGARENWLKGFKALLDEARTNIVTLLTTEWLVNEEEVAQSKTRDQRLITLVRIRQIYIPELIIRLHALLVQSGSSDRIPANITHALALPNIVADSRYGIYEDFIADGPARLEAFLKAVRLAVLKGLEEGGSDPLKTIKFGGKGAIGGGREDIQSQEGGV